MSVLDEADILAEIVKKEGLGKIDSCKKLSTGFSRTSFDINDKYIIKIGFKNYNLEKATLELNYYLNNDTDYSTRIIGHNLNYDSQGYVYTIEQKIKGDSLLVAWSNSTEAEKKEYLNQLVNIMKDIHSKKPNLVDCKAQYLALYHKFLENAIAKNIFSPKQIEYLYSLVEYLDCCLSYGVQGMIHGDIHFNNIIVSDGKLKVFDFENYTEDFLDKEFDSLFRMIRFPKSYIRDDDPYPYDFSGFDFIKSFIDENYKEVCSLPLYNERLIAYDILNSLKWIAAYPEHKLYSDVLFDESKKIRKVVDKC